MATRREREQRQIRYSSARERVDAHEDGWSPSSFKIPEGMTLFRPKKAGRYRIDVVPYLVGEGNPFSDAGFVHYERTFYTHKGLGADNVDICCPRANWKRECPICKHLAKLRSDPSADEDLIKSLREKERQLFLFLVHAERDKGVQLYECSHYMGFGEMLDKKVKASDRYENFFHLGEEGMTLEVMFEQATFSGRTYYKPENIEMVPRDEALDIDLDSLPCLDELLIEMEFEQMQDLFMQGASSLPRELPKKTEGKSTSTPAREQTRRPAREEEAPRRSARSEEPEEQEQEERPSRTPAKRDSHGEPTAEEAGIAKGDEVEHDEHGRCEVVHISGDGTSLRLKPLDNPRAGIITGVAVDSVHKLDAEDNPPEEEPEERPSRTARGNGRPTQQSAPSRRTAPKEEPEEDPDEDWGDDEEKQEEPEEPEEPEEEEKPQRRAGGRGRKG